MENVFRLYENLEFAIGRNFLRHHLYCILRTAALEGGFSRRGAQASLIVVQKKGGPFWEPPREHRIYRELPAKSKGHR